MITPDSVLAELGPTLGLAAVLAGSTRGAAELVAETLARDRSLLNGRAGIEADDGFDPTPRLRTAVIREFLASPLGRSRPPAGATGLDALGGLARAAVVLRDREQLTTGEIVSILDGPARRVTAELAAVPPGSCDAEIAELAALAPPATEVSRRYPTVLRSRQRSRRQRTGGLALAVFLVAAAVLVPTLVLPWLPVEVRDRGVWRYSHEVILASGWQLAYRSIEADRETTTILVPGLRAEPTPCTVTVLVRGVAADRDDDAERATVRGRPAEIVGPPGNATVNWEYAAEAWASAECSTRVTTSTSLLLDIAAAVRFRDSRQLLPFRVTALPAGYAVQTVGEAFLPANGIPPWGPILHLQPPPNSGRPSILVGPDLSVGSYRSPDSSESCLGAEQPVCVTAFRTDAQVPVDQRMLRYTVALAVDQLILATSPGDRSTWYDAITLPTR